MKMSAKETADLIVARKLQEQSDRIEGLENIKKAALEYVRDSYPPTAKHDIGRWLKLCLALGFHNNEVLDLLDEYRELVEVRVDGGSA